ncbi:hypothetical protein EON80_16060 [bacterium]|nr:MAG: hypothetical protein EON80_16060 [bacterium]
MAAVSIFGVFQEPDDAYWVVIPLAIIGEFPMGYVVGATPWMLFLVLGRILIYFRCAVVALGKRRNIS